MVCPCCLTARDNPAWPWFYPSCKFCSARNIRLIDTLRTVASQDKAARKTAVLKAALKWGHDEQYIRELHANGPWVEPAEAKPAVKRVR